MPFPRVVTRQNIFNSISNADQQFGGGGAGEKSGKVSSGHSALLLVIRFCVIWTCSRLTAAKEPQRARASQVLQVVFVSVFLAILIQRFFYVQLRLLPATFRRMSNAFPFAFVFHRAHTLHTHTLAHTHSSLGDACLCLMTKCATKGREWQQHVKSSINVFVVLGTHSSVEFIPPAPAPPPPRRWANNNAPVPPPYTHAWHWPNLLNFS